MRASLVGLGLVALAPLGCFPTGGESNGVTDATVATDVSTSTDTPAASDLVAATDVPAPPDQVAPDAVVIDAPSLPDIIDAPSLPDIVDAPSLPDIVDAPSLPDIVDTPSLPDITDAPSLPDIVDAPSLPDAPVCAPSGPAAGLWGWWRFDGDLRDSSGNGRHASVASGTPAFTTGTSCGAVQIRPSEAFIDLPDARLQALTLSLWVRPEAPTTTAMVTVFDGWTNSENLHASLDTVEGALRWRVGVHNTQSNTQWYPEVHLLSTAPAQTGRWTHLALTNADGAVSLYVDGRLDVRAAQSTATYAGVVPPLADYRLGVDRTGARHFSGAVDELRLYARALSSDEVAALAAAGAPPPCATGTHRCGDRCAADDSPLTCGARCDACPSSPDAPATCESGRCGVAPAQVCPPSSPDAPASRVIDDTFNDTALDRAVFSPTGTTSVTGGRLVIAPSPASSVNSVRFSAPFTLEVRGQLPRTAVSYNHFGLTRCEGTGGVGQLEFLSFESHWEDATVWLNHLARTPAQVSGHRMTTVSAREVHTYRFEVSETTQRAFIDDVLVTTYNFAVPRGTAFTFGAGTWQSTTPAEIEWIRVSAQARCGFCP